ncbi:MAG: phage tail sheath subtilisin-like domain-containing protein [Anaerolineaceae bacterium]|nr:phage tail sheath subtilisin-like domain-containing protein [Anaerolineaceae bacterium]
MPEYLSPGVYVEEVDRGPKPIEGVGTAMAAFVGFTEKAEYVREVDGEQIVQNLINKPQLITNWTQYTERYGGFVPGTYLPHAIYGYFMNGGSRCYMVSVRTFPKAQASLRNTAGKPALTIQARYAGTEGLRQRVRVSDVAQIEAQAASKKPAKGEEADKEAAAEAAPEAVKDEGTFTLVVEQEMLSGGWKVIETLKDVRLQEELVDGAKQVQVAYKNNKPSKFIEILIANEKLAVGQLVPIEQEQALMIEKDLLPAPTSEEFKGDVSKRTGVEGLEVLDDVTMVVVPDLMTKMPGEKLNLDLVKYVQSLVIAHCERLGDRVAIIDPPPYLTPQEIKEWRMNIAGFDSNYAAMYYPWITVMDPVTNKLIDIPPSGHLAGVWARSDNTRGVHKAPANEVVQGALGLAYQCTKGEQDTLNPNGVNCIRSFPGRGIRVWGARTLTSNPAWRYINVRRLFNYVEKSIENGTQWVVFEPNDRKLWARVRRDIGAFLKTVWRDGALFGSTPDEAFYVKCDDELNPPESRDLGRLIIEIGMAPVKPAEFVIFRISQWAGPGSV